MKDSSVAEDGLFNLPCRRARFLLRLTNFINGLSFGVDRSKSARNEEPSSRGAFNGGLASVDSGLQLNLAIALSGVSAKIQHPMAFSDRPKAR